MNYNGISQTVSDSTKIPDYQLKRAINVIEVGKVAKKELTAYQVKSAFQDSLLTVKDSTINELKKKDSVNRVKDKVYLDIIGNYKKTVSNQEMIYALQGMKISRLQTKKWVLLVLGVASGIVAGKLL